MNNDDSISRAEAIKALCKAGCENEYCGISCDDVKAIEDLPSAQPSFPQRHENDCISRKAAIAVADYTDYTGLAVEDVKKVTDEVVKGLKQLPSAQPEQRWIPCGKCIHADGKHRWCKILDRSINEDYFCYWAEPWKEGEAK